MTSRPPECPQCGAVVFPDSPLCETCGTRVLEPCPACGVERLITLPTCPHCGASWETEADIEARPIGALAEAWEASAEHDFPVDDTAWEEEAWQAHRRRSPAVLLAGLSAVLLLAALTVGIFAFLRPGSEGAAPGPIGTEPTPAAAPTTTTVAETTTTPPNDPAFVEPIGDPIEVDDLRLAVDAVGPLEFGTAAEEILGRLAASLGQPEEDLGPLTSDGALGTCAGDRIRTTRWGPLVVVSRGDPLVFGGYRMDRQFGTGGPAEGIRTLSGLGLGDTVAELEQIYQGFQIDYVEVPGLGPVFELRDGSGRLLIWGPITSTEEEGEVRGIYAPDSCPES